jgi:hypothetical protein
LTVVAIGGAVWLTGYWLLAYGWGTLRGCNAGVLDYLWPGRWGGCKPDVSGAAVSGTAPGVLNTTSAGGTTVLGGSQSGQGGAGCPKGYLAVVQNGQLNCVPISSNKPGGRVPQAGSGAPPASA